MDKYLKIAEKIADQIRSKTGELPETAFILGSGWGGAADYLKEKCVLPYKDLDGMPQCGVQGHAGNFIFGSLGGKRVVFLQGRFHLYEGRPAAEVVIPVLVLSSLGVKKLVLTNAAGGIFPECMVGDLVVLSDHINLTGQNPLVGLKEHDKNSVFVDMSSTYDIEMQKIILSEAKSVGLNARKGVYLQVTGPSYETPAEVNAFRIMGADAVGMSTALEAICARWCGMCVAGISFITNKAAGLSVQTLVHDDVLHAADAKGKLLSVLAARLAEKL